MRSICGPRLPAASALVTVVLAGLVTTDGASTAAAATSAYGHISAGDHVLRRGMPPLPLPLRREAAQR